MLRSRSCRPRFCSWDLATAQAVARKILTPPYTETSYFPEPYKHGDAWTEWRGEFLDYIEDCNEDFAKELKRAAYYPSEIEGMSGSGTELKMARQVYAALRKLMKDPEAKQIVKTTGDKNVYEAWRRLHFSFDPQTATVETTAMSRILNPKQAQTIGKLAAKIQRWEDRIRNSV